MSFGTMVKSRSLSLSALKGNLLACMVATAVLVFIAGSMELTKFSEPHISMLLGMGLGMTTSPLMMVWMRQVRTKRRVTKMLKELAEDRKNQNM